MKTFAITLATIAFTFIGAVQADARPGRDRDRGRHDDRHHHHHSDRRHYHRPANHVYISSYSRGVPIYTERFFIRYDRRGLPVWGYRALPPRHHYPYRGGYGQSGARVIIQGSFGR